MKYVLIAWVLLSTIISILVFNWEDSPVVVHSWVQIQSPTSSPISTPNYIVSHDFYSKTTGYWKSDNKDIMLNNYRDAIEVSYAKVIQFLLWDNTSDKHEGWTCGDYTESVHNRAESVGIKAGMAVIEFNNDYHTLLAFDTTDEGRVFFDCQKGDYQADVEVGLLYAIKDINKPNSSYKAYYTLSPSKCIVDFMEVIQ